MLALNGTIHGEAEVLAGERERQLSVVNHL